MNGDRLHALASRFASLKIDALVVSAPPNVRYLSGFTGSNSLLVVSTAGSATLFTDPRYTIQAAQQAASCAIKIVRGPLSAAVAHFIARKRWRRIGFEKARMIYSDFAALEESLPSGASLISMPPLVEALRAVKSEAEIALIRRSVLTNSQASKPRSPGFAPASPNPTSPPRSNTRCAFTAPRSPRSRPSSPPAPAPPCLTPSPARRSSSRISYY